MTLRPPLGAAVLAVAAAAWFGAAEQMHGMDMGVQTELGSFWFFASAWVLMMAAMMLPGAVPALAQRPLRAVPLFAGSYLAVWTLVGAGVWLAYRPHTAAAAGVLIIAAAAYELTPLKRECRRRCRERLRSGARFGIYCVGSSIGLMAALAAFGLMSLVSMAVVAAIVSAQKLIAPRASVDVAFALALLGLGIAVAV